MSDDQAASRRVDELADELTSVRRRGVDEIDMSTRRKRRIAAPHLEHLARTYSGDERSARTRLIRRLLADALDAWEAEGHVEEAGFVRRLFFAPDGGTPGGDRPKDLLAAARADTGLQSEYFDQRRKAYFKLFASFLTKFVEPQQSEHEGLETSGSGRGRRRLAMAAAVLLVAAFIVVMAARAFNQQPAGSSREVPTVTESSEQRSPSPDPVLTTFTFDALGPGPPVINVYPGVTDRPADRRPNGAFNHGETVTAVCKTRGRTVTSDTSIGEEPKQSNVWIRIDAGIGEMYATFVYGEMSAGTLSDLPEC